MRPLRFRCLQDGRLRYFELIPTLGLVPDQLVKVNGAGLNVDYPLQLEPPIEQFTGLKDTHSREIFEGDIVKVLEEHDGSDGIIYERVKWVWRGEAKKVHFIDGFFGYWKGDGAGFRPLLSGERFEVIGNIHETPELLP